MKICYILNAFYPVNPGETFLANEIDFIKGFDKIFVCPIIANDKSAIFSYKTPLRDVSVFRIPKFSLINKIRYVLLSLFHPEFFHEISILKSTARYSFANLVKLIRFIAHGLFCSDRVLKGMLHDKNNEFVFYSYWFNLDAFVAAELRRRKIFDNAHFISRAHRVDLYEEFDSTKYIPLRQYIIDSLDLVLPICEDGFKYLLNNYNISPNKLHIARLGTLDRGLNISKKRDRLNLLSCSWIRPVKRLGLILEALKLCDFDICWTHIGGGEGLQELQEKVELCRLPNIKIELKGKMGNDDILDYYQHGDFNVFVNVSASEGVPVSIMEAMSFGKLIIATDVGGTREIVQNCVNGFLLDSDFEVTELAEVFRRVKDMSDVEYVEMSKASRQLWEKMSNSEKNYQDFSLLLEKMDSKGGTDESF